MNESAHRDLQDLAAGLRTAIEQERGHFDPALVAEAEDLLARTSSRLHLGEDSTVVAFAGSTGSGKSSLFNAVAGLEIAEVGVRRPTTSIPTACVWGEGGEDLLTWLDVPEANRTWRESALDGDDEESLHGLVLLDLPDHDSTAAAHREESDRLVGLVDMVIWVVDPQKYADFALHSRYLTHLTRQAGNMVVVLNQIDRLDAAEREECLTDLRGLLDHDGLADARLTGASAKTREGVDRLRTILTETVAARHAASERLRRDLEHMSERFRAALGRPLEDPRNLPGTDGLVSAMADAAGVDALVQTVTDDYARRAYKRTGYPPLAWAQRGRADPLGAKHGQSRSALLAAAVPEASRTQSARVELEARRLVDDAVTELPPSWQDEVKSAEKQSTRELTRTLDEAVTAVSIDRRSPGWWGFVGFLQILFLVLSVLGVLGLVACAVLLGFDLVEVSPWLWIAAGGLTVVGVLGSVITSSSAAGARERGAAKAGEEAGTRMRAAVAEAAAGSFLDPIVAVLSRHYRVHAELEGRGTVDAGKAKRGPGSIGAGSRPM